MTRSTTSALGAAHAHPYVGGQSRRIKAEPTQISRLAASMMCASGAFSTKAQAPRPQFGRFFGALAVLLAAGTFALAGDVRSTDDNARMTAYLAQSDALFDFGVSEYRAPAPVAASASELSAQDRFEIARMFALSAAAEAANQKVRSAAQAPTRLAQR